MEEKNTIKVRVSTVVLSILIILLVVVVGISLYQLKITNDNREVAESKVSNLEKDSTKLMEKVNDLTSRIENAQSELNEKSNNEILNNTIENNQITNSNNNNADNSNNLNLGLISITLPKEWIDYGKFSITFNKNVNSDNEILYSYNFGSTSNFEFGGSLFTIVVAGSNFDYENWAPQYKIITSNSKYIVLATYPSDVEFSEEEALKKDYQYLAKYIDKIIESVKFN